MKNIQLKLFTAFLLTVAVVSCKKVATPYLDTVAKDDRALVYIARFNGNTQNLTIFPYVDSARTLKFSAAFGSLGLPGADIPVRYKVDVAAFDSVNKVRVASGMTAFQRFPEGSYTISNLAATIPAGKVNSELTTVSYLSKKFDPLVDYLLPISVESAGDYAVGSNKTFFIVAPKLQELIAVKSGWTVTTDSEELVGEGTANGKASFVIDDNVNTYWHTQYQGGSPAFPHWINIDMKNEVYVTRVDLAARQNSTTGFIRFQLEGSTDGVTWTDLGKDLVFDPNIKAFQSYPVTPGYRRYIRVTGLRAQSATMTSTHLAEVTVYRY